LRRSRFSRFSHHTDAQMKTMQAMHDMLMQAASPEQRSDLMAGHMQVMQHSMALMGGMGGMGSMGGTAGLGALDGDMGKRHQTMDKRMQMMPSMMQMMMDRTPAAAGKP